MDENAINNCEAFSKSTLSLRLKENSAEDLNIFFGAYFAKIPEQFEFLDGDRALIKRLVNHLQEENRKDGNLQRFLCTTEQKGIQIETKDLIHTSIGSFFGNTIGHTTKTIVETKIDLLYTKSKDLLKTVDHSKMLAKFTKDMVSVRMNGDEISGSVKCVYCSEDKQIYYNKTYFVVANMKRHLSHCRKNFNKAEHDDVTSNKETCVDKTRPSVPEESNLNDSVICLEIEALDEREKLIHNQIFQQIDDMKNTSLKNKDSDIEIGIAIQKNQPSKIRCALVEADGDCLIGAIAHQIYHHPLRSTEHKEATEKLRANAVDYIKKNIDKFKTLICYRDDFEKFGKGKSMGKKIESFIEKLGESGFWGGSEFLIAISRLFSLNIIIINQGSSCGTALPFNFEFQSCAVIVYCKYKTLQTQEPKNNNHYNSVTSIDRYAIVSCTNKIIELLTPVTITID